jgi:hypothetical protein
MEPTKVEIENFFKKNGIACYDNNNKYVELTFKNSNLELRYYYK